MPLHERIDGILRLIFILLLGVLPWFFVPISLLTPTGDKLLLVEAVVFCVTIAWAIARLSEGGVRTSWTGVYLAGIGVVAAYGISTILAGNTSVSLVGSGSDTDSLAFVGFCFALVPLVAHLFIRHPGAVNRAVRALLCGGLIAMLLELLHFALPSFVLGGALSGQTGNVVGSWHDFGFFVFVIVFASVALLRSPTGKGIWHAVLLMNIILGLVLLVIADYADVWEMLAGAAVVLIAVRLYRARGLSLSLALPLCIVLISLFAAIYGSSLSAHLPDSIRITQTDVRPSLLGTFEIGRGSLAAPLPFVFGTGPNTFTHQWSLYKPVGVNATPFWDTDFSAGVASIPTAFITVGFFGFLAWICFAFVLIAIAIRGLRSSPQTPIAALAIPLSLVVLALFALQVLTVPGPALTLILYIISGLMIALFTPSIVRERMLPLSTRTSAGQLSGVAVGILVCGLLVSSAALLRVQVSQALVSRAIAAYNSGADIGVANSYVQDALAVYPNNDLAQRTAVQLGFVTLQQLASKAGADHAATVQLTATLQATIQHGLAAVSINGASYENWLQLALLYSELAGSDVAGAYENAYTALRHAIEKNPYSPLPHVYLAQLDSLQGNNGAALTELGLAIALKPDLASAYFMASQIYARGRSYDNAIAAAVLATQYAPDDSSAWYNRGAIEFAAEQYAQATRSLKQALVLQPQSTNALYLLGLAYYQQHDVADALATFRSLDLLAPNQPLVLGIIANLSAGKPLSSDELGAGSPPAAPTK